MNTIMGWNVSVIVQAVELFVALHAIRLAVTWAIRRHRRATSNVVDLDMRRPNPDVDEHVAFPEDAVLLDFAAARARR